MKSSSPAGPGPRSANYLRSLEGEFPRLRLVDKDGDGLSRLIDGALRIVTLGGQSAYRSAYVTTLGATIYLPTGFWDRDDDSCYIVLRHEAVHLRQFRRLGFPAMAFLYLIPFVPLGLAFGRARLEWEAYAETLRATAEVHGAAAARDPSLHAHVVRQFTSGAYGWMWPFPSRVRAWIDDELAAMGRDSRA